MSVTQYINLSLQIWGCVLTLIIIVCLYLSKTTDRQRRRIYTFFLLSNAGVMLFDALALCFRGGDDTIAFYAVRISNCLGFCFGALVSTAFLHYITLSFKNPEKLSRTPLLISRATCIIYLCAYIINVFVPFFYYIDDENIYHRLSFYQLTFIPGFLIMGLALYLLFRYKNQIDRTYRIIYILYMLITIPIFIVQMFVYGLNLVNFVGMVFIIVIFLFIEAEQAKKIARQENEILSSRISISLSQIQPHFLYNCLTSIYCLCDEKPEAAKEAISNFSKYLRGNLDSIRQTNMTSFAYELGLIEAYLNLEKMRYDDYLKVEYDIQVSGFLLPVLTVQPIVENSATHGISDLPDGGCITISTREAADCYEIRVIDNGVGFDEKKIYDDGRTHIGISNVRSRLEIMCNGTLQYESNKSGGTTAIIKIPK